MNKFNKKGFTLIEMLVVIAIIAVLVSIVVPTISSSTGKAKAATDAANLRSAKAVATIKALEGVTGDLSASECGVPADGKYDGGDFTCNIAPNGADNSVGATVTVTYGGNGIEYYANIAGGGSAS